MGIVIRHNGALNNAAEGVAAGVGQGLQLRQRQQGLDDEKALAERRLKLAESVQAAEMEIRAKEEGRRADAYARQKQSEADQKEAAGTLTDFATSGGKDPNFQPNYVETADPYEQQLNAENAHAAEVGKIIASKDPSLADEFIGVYQQHQHQRMLEGLAAKEQSQWSDFLQDPSLGQLPDAEEINQRGQEALKGLGAAKDDPKALEEAVKLSRAARQQTQIKGAQFIDKQRARANNAALYGGQVNTLESLLPQLPAAARAPVQQIVQQMGQTLALYTMGGIDEGKLHDTMYRLQHEARGDMKPPGAGRGTGKPAEPAWKQARDMAVEDFDKGLLGDPASMDAKERDRVTRQRQAEYQRQIEGGAGGATAAPAQATPVAAPAPGAQPQAPAPAAQAAPVEQAPARSFTEVKAPDRARFVTALRAAVLRGDYEAAKAIMQQSGIDMDSIPKSVRDQILAPSKEARAKEREREVDQMYGNSDMPR